MRWHTPSVDHRRRMAITPAVRTCGWASGDTLRLEWHAPLDIAWSLRTRAALGIVERERRAELAHQRRVGGRIVEGASCVGCRAHRSDIEWVERRCAIAVVACLTGVASRTRRGRHVSSFGKDGPSGITDTWNVVVSG